MMLRRIYLQHLTLAISLVFLTLLGLQIIERQHQQDINDAIRLLQSPRLVEATEIDLTEPEVQFAYAHHLQQRGMFEDAVDAYGKAERISSPTMLKLVYYNMGNLYLQQAIETAEKMGIDRATALADVAKDLYKSALKKDPEFWAAKYNFEAAQRLSRDLPLGDLQESGEAQESSEELWSAMPGFPLGLP
jgi:mxaK protein